MDGIWYKNSSLLKLMRSLKTSLKDGVANFHTKSLIYILEMKQMVRAYWKHALELLLDIK